MGQTSYQPYFAKGTVFENGLPAASVGFSEDSLAKFKYKAWGWVLSDEARFRPTTVEDLSKLLRKQTEKLLPSKSSNTAKAFGLSYLTGIWARYNVRAYRRDVPNNQGKDASGSIIVFEHANQWFNVKKFLQRTELNGLAHHSAILVRELIREGGSDLGVTPYSVVAWMRSMNRHQTRLGGAKAYNLVLLPNGIRVPFNVDQGGGDLEVFKRNHLLFYPCQDPVNFPQAAPAFEIFFALYFGSTVEFPDGRPDPNGYCLYTREPTGYVHRDIFTGATLQQWFQSDLTGILELRKRNAESFLRRNGQ